MVVIYYYSFVSLYQIYNFIFVLNLPEKILLRRSFLLMPGYNSEKSARIFILSSLANLISPIQS